MDDRRGEGWMIWRGRVDMEGSGGEWVVDDMEGEWWGYEGGVDDDMEGEWWMIWRGSGG